MLSCQEEDDISYELVADRLLLVDSYDMHEKQEENSWYIIFVPNGT